MASERAKEIRDWVTFVVSVLTLVLIPFGYLVLDRQRLQIEKDISLTYVSRDQMTAHQLWETEQHTGLDKDNQRTKEQLTKFDGKLDALSIKLDATIQGQAVAQQQMNSVQDKLRDIQNKHN